MNIVVYYNIILCTNNKIKVYGNRTNVIRMNYKTKYTKLEDTLQSSNKLHYNFKPRYNILWYNYKHGIKTNKTSIDNSR